MRRFVLVLLLVACAWLVGPSALAASYNLGTLPVPSSQPIGGWEIGWPGSSHVLDTYAFQVSSAAELTAQAVEFELWGIVNFGSLTAELLDSSCGYCAVDTATGTSGFLLSYADLLPANSYVLRITGILGNWAIKGIYYGQLAVSAVPVPPALLLFGTAIAGAAILSRRRRRQGLPFAGEGEVGSRRAARDFSM